MACGWRMTSSSDCIGIVRGGGRGFCCVGKMVAEFWNGVVQEMVVFVCFSKSSVSVLTTSYSPMEVNTVYKVLPQFSSFGGNVQLNTYLSIFTFSVFLCMYTKVSTYLAISSRRNGMEFGTHTQACLCVRSSNGADGSAASHTNNIRCAGCILR
jgi:hypothetical protein